MEWFLKNQYSLMVHSGITSNTIKKMPPKKKLLRPPLKLMLMISLWNKEKEIQKINKIQNINSRVSIEMSELEDLTFQEARSRELQSLGQF